MWCGIPATGHSPCQTVPVWVLHTSCSSSKTVPAWVLSMGCTRGMDCSSTGSPWAALPAPLWALHRLQLPWEHIHLLWHGLQCGYLLWCDPPWAVGGQPTVFMGSRGISAPAPGMPPSCSPSLTLTSAGLFSLTFFSHSSWAAGFFPYNWFTQIYWGTNLCCWWAQLWQRAGLS